jgi:hypothetical protein
MFSFFQRWPIYGFLHHVVLNVLAFRKRNLVASIFRSTELSRRMPKPVTASIRNSTLAATPTSRCVTHNTNVNYTSELCVVSVWAGMVLLMFPTYPAHPAIDQAAYTRLYPKYSGLVPPSIQQLW